LRQRHVQPTTTWPCAHWHPFTEVLRCLISRLDAVDGVVGASPSIPTSRSHQRLAAFGSATPSAQADPEFNGLPIRCIRTWLRPTPGLCAGPGRTGRHRTRGLQTTPLRPFFFQCPWAFQELLWEERGDPYQAGTSKPRPLLVMRAGSVSFGPSQNFPHPPALFPKAGGRFRWEWLKPYTGRKALGPACGRRASRNLGVDPIRFSWSEHIETSREIPTIGEYGRSRRKLEFREFPPGPALRLPTHLSSKGPGRSWSKPPSLDRRFNLDKLPKLPHKGQLLPQGRKVGVWGADNSSEVWNGGWRCLASRLFCIELDSAAKALWHALGLSKPAQPLHSDPGISCGAWSKSCRLTSTRP